MSLLMPIGTRSPSSSQILSFSRWYGRGNHTTIIHNAQVLATLDLNVPVVIAGTAA